MTARMVVLKPGDRVLIAAGAVDPREAGALVRRLEAHFPGVDFSVLYGVDSVTVLPADDAPRDIVDAEAS